MRDAKGKARGSNQQSGKQRKPERSMSKKGHEAVGDLHTMVRNPRLSDAGAAPASGAAVSSATTIGVRHCAPFSGSKTVRNPVRLACASRGLCKRALGGGGGGRLGCRPGWMSGPRVVVRRHLRGHAHSRFSDKGPADGIRMRRFVQRWGAPARLARRVGCQAQPAGARGYSALGLTLRYPWCAG